VAVPAHPASDAAGPLTGWVAAASKTGEAWVRPDAIACPAPGAVTVEDLAALTSPSLLHGGLACFGRGTSTNGGNLRFTAELAYDCTNPAPSAAPDWMTAGDRSFTFELGVRSFRAIPHALFIPPIECDTAPSGLFDVEGRFDDPDAATCTDLGAGGPVASDRRVAVYLCRTRFVVNYVYPVQP
jgi:hypothetical protein